MFYTFSIGFPESSVDRLQCRRPGFDPWVGKILWRRERLPTPVFWPRELRGLYSPWGRKELDTTEQLSLALLCHAVKCALTGTLAWGPETGSGGEAKRRELAAGSRTKEWATGTPRLGSISHLLPIQPPLRDLHTSPAQGCQSFSQTFG